MATTPYPFPLVPVQPGNPAAGAQTVAAVPPQQPVPRLLQAVSPPPAAAKQVTLLPAAAGPNGQQLARILPTDQTLAATGTAAPTGPAPNLTGTPAPPLNQPSAGGKQLAQDLGAPAQPNVGLLPSAPGARLLRDQTELTRLQNSGPGWQQIAKPVDADGDPTGENPGFGRKLLGGLARIGDVGLTMLAPGFAMAIPGTTLHHALDVRAANARIGQDQGQLQQNAQTAMLDAQPELKQLAAENSQLKTEGYLQHVSDQGQHYQDQNVNAEAANRTRLAQAGYAVDEKDPTGKTLRPLRYEEMSPVQQSVHDLHAAQAEEQDAAAQLKKAQNDPTSPMYRLQLQRLQVAQRNAETARGRLGLSQQQTQAHLYGTDMDGRPLPGAMLDANGEPVGSIFQGNVRPTGQERNKADMAGSAAEQLEALRGIVHARPDIFGPAAGRTTDLNVWLGSQDPDAQRYLAARTIAGDHLAGTFGGRSEHALAAIDNAIGQFKDNPDAVDAGLSQLEQANSRFQQAGTVHTASGAGVSRPGGGHNGQSAPAPSAPGGSLPVAAQASLVEGHNTQFGNGQVWTKRNGQPVRVK